MRVVLHSPERTWELGWGVSCIGSDPACEVRLDGAPPVAGVLVRWLESVTVLGVGNPPGLYMDGSPLIQRKLDLRRIASSELYGRWGAGGVQLSVGQVKLTLSVENVPSPGRAAEFAAADLEAVMRAAIAHALRAGANPEGIGTADTLPELVARMAGCLTARFDGPAEPPGDFRTNVPAANPHATQTMILRSHSGSWTPRALTLQWREQAPSDFRPEEQAAGLAATLEDTLSALAQGRHAAGDPPAYGGGSIEMPQMRQKCGPYTLLGPDDFDHLGLPAGRVRTPQLLVSTIGGHVDMVDLASEPELTVDGVKTRRARLRAESQVRIFDTPLKVTTPDEPAAEYVVPGRVFRHLALWTDPVTQIARLGLLLPHLRTRIEQRHAYLLAAVSGVRGAGIVAGLAPRVGPRRFTPLMLRWLGESLLLYQFPYCRVIDTALRRALEGGGELLSPNASEDARLCDPDDTPADHTAVFWGPLAVLTLDGGEMLMCWKHRWDSKFHPAEISYLRAILSGMKVDGLLPSQDLARIDLPPDRKARGGSAALRIGRMRLPLGDVTVLGNALNADVRVVLDPSLSARHMLVVREATGHRMFDLRSFNGVTIGGRRVNEVKLEAGRDLDVASTTVRYEPSEEEAQAQAHDATYLAEDVELEAEPARVREAERLLRLGQDLAAAPDVIQQARWIQVTGAAMLDCHLHLVEVTGMGSPVVVHGSTAPEPPDPGLFVRARPLITGCLQAGRPMGPDPEGLMAAPAAGLPGGQQRPLAMVFQRPGGFPPEKVREVWAFGSLLGMPAGTTRPMIEHGTQRVAVDGPTWVGRARDCHVVLDHPTVSRRHVLIVPGRSDPPFLWAVDFNSDTGIKVKGKAFDRVKLHDGDVLEIGPFQLTARLPQLPLVHRTGERIAMLERAPVVVALGRQRASPPPDVLTALVEHLRAALDVARVVVIGEREPLAASTAPELAQSEALERFAGHSEVQHLVRAVRKSRRAWVRTLEVDRIYRKAAMASIQMVMPLTAKTALGVPFGAGDPRVLVIATLRSAPLAFTPAQLALAVAALSACTPAGS